MFLAILGGCLLLPGFLFVIDTITWKIESGENFIDYAIQYAAIRHEFFAAELMIGILAVLTGLILVIIGLCKIRKNKNSKNL